MNFAGEARDPSLIRAMTYAVRRRGPDGSGVANLGPCQLGHTRLSIIDLEYSAQPMTMAGIPVTLVYNGELYNYKQLRNELARAGESFVTKGDTEVILRMIARYGQGALERFNGMFGLAAWNSASETLLLARDPIGEKPLFYAIAPDGTFVFGSEIKAVLCDPTLPRRPHMAALRQALRYRAVYGEQTLYEGVRQLMPGCLVSVSRTGVRIQRYFDLVEATDRVREELKGESEGDVVRRGQALFEDSVGERLMADVPVGAFLSGGLDSSMLVAAMCRRRSDGDSVRTYSVGFTGDPHSELPFAREVATMLGTDHEEVRVQPRDYEEHLSALTECRDGPVSEPADVAIACMSRRARLSVKVVLSGEGADEAFAGYPKYGVAGLPEWLHSLARHLGPAFIRKTASIARFDGRRAAVVARALACGTEVERLAQWFSYVEQESLAEWLPGVGWNEDQWKETLLEQSLALQRVSHWMPEARMQGVDCLTWLPGNMLERGDRMTMAEGLEQRPPFLSPRLVAFGLALPGNLKIRRGSGKWIVKQWARGTIPEAVRRRRKWGFRAPLAEWFRAELRELVHDVLLSKAGLCGRVGNPQAIGRLLQQHDSGEVDHSLALWTLLTVEMWSRRVVATGVSRSQIEASV